MPRSSNRAVLVHTCEYGHPDLDNGEVINCSCKERITVRHANALVAWGIAVFKKAPLGATDYRQILKTGRVTHVPRAPTIGAAKWWENVCNTGNEVIVMHGHIERAYIAGDLRSQERIEIYGEMTREAWNNVGAPSGVIHVGHK